MVKKRQKVGVYRASRKELKQSFDTGSRDMRGRAKEYKKRKRKMERSVDSP